MFFCLFIFLVENWPSLTPPPLVENSTNFFFGTLPLTRLIALGSEPKDLFAVVVLGIKAVHIVELDCHNNSWLLFFVLTLLLLLMLIPETLNFIKNQVSKRWDVVIAVFFFLSRHMILWHYGLLAYLHTCIPAYFHTCFLAYSAYLHICILEYLHTCILAYLHTCILEYLHICKFAYLHTCILTYLHTCILA